MWGGGEHQAGMNDKMLAFNSARSTVVSSEEGLESTMKAPLDWRCGEGASSQSLVSSSSFPFSSPVSR
jgi:hypothetical protein